MKAKARWRIPAFAWDYMTGGIGMEENVRRNSDDLQRIMFMPRYLSEPDDKRQRPAIMGYSWATARKFDRELDRPFVDEMRRLLGG